MSVRASRFIAWALRHSPEEAGIRLDLYGWAAVADVLRSIKRRGHDASPATLAAIVRDDPKGRYSFSRDGRMIRANYGHSVAVLPDVEATEPPAVLYHGTATNNLSSIKREGLLRNARQFVHLTREIAQAFQVGRRYGTPVVVPIDAKMMHTDGLSLYPMTPSVWLTVTVPSQYLDFSGLLFTPEQAPSTDAPHLTT